MKYVLILLILSSWTSGQLIYPDQFESISVTARPQRLQSDALQINNAFGTQQSSPSLQAVSGNFAQQQNSASNSQVQTNEVISKGVLNFALRMDDAVSIARTRFIPGSRENVIFSPISVAAALALVLLGSARRTFDEVSAILGLNAGLDISRNSEAVHQKFGSLIAAITGRPGQPVESSFASGIFVQDGYPIRPEFEAASKDLYKSDVINLDFVNAGGVAQQTLNAWVNNRTRGKIPSILSSPPSPATSVIIASALYFNGEWNQHFIEGATRRKIFTVSPGETVSVDMMYNGGDFAFFEDKQLRAKIVGLPYKGNEVTMYIVLPTDLSSDSLRTLERRLNPDTVDNLIRNMRIKTCIIGLPRMKLSSTLSLRDALQFLGLNSLFDPNTSDLSLISEGYNSYLTQSPAIGTDGINFGSRGQTSKPDIVRQPQPDRITQPPQFRQSYFTYDDTVRGYHVEQWATGFKIGRIPRQRRRRSLYPRKWRAEKSSVSQDEELKVKSVQRSKRQAVQNFNRDFQNEIRDQNQNSYGLDDLRNNLVSRNPGLYAEDVLHRVEIDITEKGTEAAAATVAILNKDGNQKRLVADHPFLFFIRHETTGLILFWGSVNKPTPNYPSPASKQ